MKLGPLGIVLSLVSLSLSCSESPGQVSVTLEGLSAADKSLIVEFVFVVQPADTTVTPILFPAACVVNGCLGTKGCGFLASSAGSYKPEITFAEVPDKTTFTLTACGLDLNQAVVVAGSASVDNTAGKSPTVITMSDTNTAPCVVIPRC